MSFEEESELLKLLGELLVIFDVQEEDDLHFPDCIKDRNSSFRKPSFRRALTSYKRQQTMYFSLRNIGRILSDEDLLAENQEMFRNAGLPKLIKEILNLVGSDKQWNASHQQFLRICYKILTYFCKANARNQNLLMSLGPMDLWLKHLVDHIDVGAINFIMELYRDNYDLIIQVHEEVIAALISLIQHDDEGAIHATVVLKSMVIVEDMPVTRNQVLVMNAMVEQLSNHLQTMLQNFDKRTNESLQLHTSSLVDLAALCCMGFNSTTEDPAQGMVPLGCALQVLAETEYSLPLDVQLPFITFLREVWWISETESASEEKAQWLARDEWWLVIKNFCRITSALNDDAWDPEDGDLETHIVFIFDGIIPCMCDFLDMCWEPGTTGSKRNDLINGVVEEVSKLLDTECGNVFPNVTYDQLQLYIRFIETSLRTKMYGNHPNGNRLNNLLKSTMVLAAQKASDTECGYLGRYSSQGSSGHEATSERPHINKLARKVIDPSPEKCIKKALANVQQMCEQQRSENDVVDDLSSFTDTICAAIGNDRSKEFRAMIQYMRRDLPEDTRLGILEFFTCLIKKHRTNTEQLKAVQNELDVLGATSLMIYLVEQNDFVSTKALDFGIALLEGGNFQVQASSLECFWGESDYFFCNMHTRLHKTTVALRARKREMQFLRGTMTNATTAQRTKVRTAKNDMDIAERILRLLQLLCEGHNLEMQNYVRNQVSGRKTGKTHTFNLVHEVVLFLREVVSDPDLNTVMAQVAIQAFNTLTEFCQGPCQLNQRALVSVNLPHEINVVLVRTYDSCEPHDIFAMRCQAVVTALSLLEGCSDRSRALSIANALSWERLGSILDGMWDEVEDRITEGKSFSAEEEENLDMAFNVFILMFILQASVDDPQLREVLSARRSYEFFKSILGVIEIARGNIIEKVYFRKPTGSMILEKQSRQQLLALVDRSSPSSRLADFFQRCHKLINELDHKKMVADQLEQVIPTPPLNGPMWYMKYVYPQLKCRRRFLVHNIHNGTTLWDNAILLLATCLNIVMVLFFPTPGNEMCWQLRVLIGLLGINLFGLCLLTCASLYFLQLPLLLPQAEKKLVFSLSVLHQIWKTERAAYLRHSHYVLLTLAALSGLVISPLFYSFHLLILINKSELLVNVTQSVTLNGKSLLLTALLGAIVIHMFSLTAYLLFPEDFINEDDGQPQCHTVMQCFLFSMTSGIRSGGGLGDLLTKTAWSHGHHLQRILFDFLFHIIVIVIFLNIIFGIILDTFAELRDAKQKVEEDTMGRCFICGISADIFDQHVDGGFDKHCRESHNMWQYLFFMYHLKRKDKDEFTGQESYVYNKMQIRDMSFFPFNRSMDLDMARQASKRPYDLQADYLVDRDMTLNLPIPTISGLDPQYYEDASQIATVRTTTDFDASVLNTTRTRRGNDEHLCQQVESLKVSVTRMEQTMAYILQSLHAMQPQSGPPVGHSESLRKLTPC
uniref:RyR/IP3R Homology associated domain-containing protein n=1 Tax=Eutreptiella gymnastica TaxID=73025 RepID=A0A7S1IMD9_9EUGL